MKIAYISRPSLADADFPLIKEMQKNADVTFYLFITPYNCRATLFNIQKVYPKFGIFPATIYPEFSIFQNYLNTKNIRIVNFTKRSDFHPKNLLVMLLLLKELIQKKFKIIHLTWPPFRNKILFYLLRKKLVLTLHDPFPHSQKNNSEFECCRKLSFKLIKKLIFLSSQQIKPFIDTYHVPSERIFLSKLGAYDAIHCFSPKPFEEKNYILFFGAIAPYKGIEYLLQAIHALHNQFPNIKLYVAGAGKIYFDENLYTQKTYIQIINRFLTMEETAGLLQNASFVVCPYKDATQSGVIQTAFSMNVPVLATDVGNFNEIIEHEKTGLIIPPNNQDALQNAIRDLLLHSEKLEAFRKNIQKQTSSDWKTIVQNYLNCYRAKL